MNEKLLFKFLKKQSKIVLLDLLKSAFHEMKTNQKNNVFGYMMEQVAPSGIDRKQVIKDVKKFCEESLAGVYYAPFDINSRNFSHIPEETEEWFEKLNDNLISSTQLSKQKDHLYAIDCFSMLYDLIEKMEAGDEIIFADEYGTWMISGDEKVYIKAYITSLASTKKPDDYAMMTIPLIRKDSYESFSKKVYSIAMKAADKEQQKYLKAEIKKHNIRIK
ncbi:MAG TPA: hypothetical protein ENI58_09700 [Nitrospirae bacterium]|nr:hypothetical protein [Nitrospirota bacterium]